MSGLHVWNVYIYHNAYYIIQLCTIMIIKNGCMGLWLAAGRWYSPGTPVSSANKTDRHDIAEILLNVALSTISHAIKSQIVNLKPESSDGWFDMYTSNDFALHV